MVIINKNKECMRKIIFALLIIVISVIPVYLEVLLSSVGHKEARSIKYKKMS